MDADARLIIDALGLEPHPEGGFYRETFRSPRAIENGEGKVRSASTAIYFLLPGGAFSAWHMVTSDEVWHWYDGDPVALHLLSARDGERKVTLGRDLRGGQVPQYVVPAGVHQAAVALGPRYALCGCTVAPGFDFADFSMPPRAELCSLFPDHQTIIEAFTRG